jgi:hypothetical protein
MSETRKLAAILVAECLGYSRLAGADEERTLTRLRGVRSESPLPLTEAASSSAPRAIGCELAEAQSSRLRASLLAVARRRRGFLPRPIRGGGRCLEAAAQSGLALNPDFYIAHLRAAAISGKSSYLADREHLFGRYAKRRSAGRVTGSPSRKSC